MTSTDQRVATAAVAPATPESSDAGLVASDLRAGYGARTIIDGLNLRVPTGEITALIGPNACGKSTLLGTMSRLIPAQHGTVLLDGADIHTLPTRDVAQRLGILPQSPTAPEGITVAELVRRGRHPHRRFGSRATDDDAVVARSLIRTGIADLADRGVDTLSGGQRQRAWIAMALAQETSVLLLDEPTSYLDIAHQVEVMDLLLDLRDAGTTIVVVLHDLAQAARYASYVVALKDGEIVSAGSPHAVVTSELVEKVFGVRARVIPDPDTGAPLVLARGRHDT